MILWCAYCQRFMGERPPYAAFAVTHGICVACDGAGRIFDSEAVERVQPIAAFHRERFEVASRGDLADANAMVERAYELGIEPLELLLGFVRPALAEIGCRWETNRIQVADEHRFTSFCERVFALVDGAAPRVQSGPVVLVAAADGNYHSLGPRIVDYWLRRRNFRSHLVYPALPAKDLLRLADDLQPAFIAVSVALAPQLDGARDVVQGAKVPVVIGGAAVREWRPRGLTCLTTIDELDTWLGAQDPALRAKIP